MPSRILHLLDSTTSLDAVQILRPLLKLRHEQHVGVLGHQNTGNLLDGVREVRFIPSMGWLDPTGWRGVKRLIQEVRPTHLQVWGSGRALVAGAMANFQGVRAATFVEAPSHPRLLRLIDQKKMGRGELPWAWIATSDYVRSGLLKNELGAECVRVILPGVEVGQAKDSGMEVRRRLGIAAEDGPILLHTGDGKHGRQDFAIWTAAILAQLFPRTRLILQADPRTHVYPGMDRFGSALPDEQMVIEAPPDLNLETLLSAAEVLLVTADRPIATVQMLLAMAVEVPIVATPIGPIMEFLTHGKDALIASHTGIGINPPVGDKTIKPRAIAGELERLLGDNALRQVLVKNAAGTLRERFGMDAMLQAYEALWQ